MQRLSAEELLSTPETPAPGLPASVQIGASCYRVSCDEREFQGEEHRAQQNSLWGVANYELEAILIKPAQTPNHQRNSLMHEVLHAIDWDRNLGLPKEIEERVIDCLAGGLVDFMERNPKAVEFLRTPQRSAAPARAE